jgi:CO dehydrogenase/acetyl-CoA synthase beta subunit
MPSQLIEELKPRLVPLLMAKGHPDLFDKIADETTAATIEDLTDFLTRVGHPALAMKPLM